LQFPTGETAMKIEGLGETNHWKVIAPRDVDDPIPGYKDPLTTENARVGERIMSSGGEQWIITDVLGDGKFKAVPKWAFHNDEKVYRKAKQFGYIDDIEGSGEVTGDFTKDDPMMNALRDSQYNESFDISGKVDTSNPIYRFYEKDVQKYLTKKYGAKVVTDPQGVKWLELDVPKEAGKMPVEAFGAGLLAAPMLSGRE